MIERSKNNNIIILIISDLELIYEGSCNVRRSEI